jgi:hypothetical protein
LGDSEHRLLLTVHHIVSDTASIYSVFLPELVALYEAFATGKSSPLPELSIQYADFAHWQREQWQAGSWAEQMAYWKRQLSGEIRLTGPGPVFRIFEAILKRSPSRKA